MLLYMQTLTDFIWKAIEVKAVLVLRQKMHKLPAFKTQSSHLQHCIGLHVCDVDTYPPEKKTHKKNNNKKQTKNNNNLLISHHETIAPLT